MATRMRLLFGEVTSGNPKAERASRPEPGLAAEGAGTGGGWSVLESTAGRLTSSVKFFFSKPRRN